MAAIGVDLGGTKVLAGRVFPDGTVQDTRKVPTPQAGPSAVVEALTALIRELAGGDEPVGIGVPGMVQADGTVTRAPNLAGFERPIALGAMLAGRLGRPVVVDNDVNAAAVAEHRLGAGRGRSDLAVVLLGTGVGGGIILDGTLRRGPNGMAAEVGHLTVHPGGERCGCGGRGHLEAYAGRRGLERRARERHAAGHATRLVELAGDRTMKSKVFARALQDGDEVTHHLVAEAADALAVAIGNVAATLDVQHFVVGGGLGERLGDRFLAQVRRSPAFGGFGPEGIDLRLSERLSDAGVVGAGLLALDRT